MTNFLLLSLVLVLSMESAATVSYEYVELRLALQWPISYCNTGNPKIKCNPLIHPKFTMHGLWPSPYSNGFFKCPAPTPSIKNLYQQVSNDLQGEMEIYWPNLNSKTRKTYLWEHEYEQHGYCFTEFPNPEGYFRTAIGIKIHIENIMPIIRSRSGTTLKSGLLYRVDDLRRVTTNAGGELIIGLRCNYAFKSEIPQLLEIVFCIDTNKNPKNCPYYVDMCNSRWNLYGVDKTGWFLFP